MEYGYTDYMTAPQQQPYAQQPLVPDELMEGMVIQSTPPFDAPTGDYNFYVKCCAPGYFQPKNPQESKIPACRTMDYTLLIPYRNPDTGEIVYGQTIYSLKLTPKLMNVLAKFFESTGAVPEFAQFAIDFKMPLNRTGVCAVEQRAGTGGVYSSVRDVYRPSQRPAVTFNDGYPFEPQQQTPQANYGYGA